VSKQQIPHGQDLITGRYYRIIEIDPHDPDPSLKVGDVVRCAAQEPGCIDPENVENDGMGTQWFADYDARWDDGEGAYRTLVTEVEEVGAPS
jgi:hypothetical protein